MGKMQVKQIIKLDLESALIAFNSWKFTCMCGCACTDTCERRKRKRERKGRKNDRKKNGMNGTERAYIGCRCRCIQGWKGSRTKWEPSRLEESRMPPS